MEGLTLYDGFYKVEGNWYQLLRVEGNTAEIKLSVMGDMSASIAYGDFGNADPEIQKITGIDAYNVEITCTAEGATRLDGAVEEGGGEVGMEAVPWGEGGAATGRGSRRGWRMAMVWPGAGMSGSTLLLNQSIAIGGEGDLFCEEFGDVVG